MAFTVIDLFAGPGGLAEGFSSLVNAQNERIFNVKLSIEKDTNAHQTLQLRSFLRQFPHKELPIEYYQFLESKITLNKLYEAYPDKFIVASGEAWLATLGKTPTTEIDLRIHEAIGLDTDWVLIGGPPCQAFSSAGRSRVGGISEDDNRVYLYKEYLRIIAEHKPAIFVMENVEGLLSAKLNNEKIFSWILRDLSDPSSVFSDIICPRYKIHSLSEENVTKDSHYLIKAEDYEVPQKRHRVILVGVRDDIKQKPGIMETAPQISLESVIGELPRLRSGISKSFSCTIQTPTANGNIKKKRLYNKIVDNYDNWANTINTFRAELDKKIDNNSTKFIRALPKSSGKEFLKSTPYLISTDHALFEWYFDGNLPGVTHHVTRTHLSEDLKRYLFASLFADKKKRSPKLKDYKEIDINLLPDHENVESGHFADRFRVQLPSVPATTITSHISKDGHYFIHYDPTQCRSLTVREAARIQTFPDNYFFIGSRTAQYHQVGNAVPPRLAYQISKIVNKLLKEINSSIVSESQHS